MKNPLRSSYSTEGRRMAGARALWRANGMKEEQFGKPIIAIVNSFTQFVPGHVHLHEAGQLVKAEIERLGCFAAEFNTIAIDDGIAMGHDGMLYSLPSRDIIADSVEYMVNAHKVDAMVCISNCDKITPGMLMAAMRLNIPTVFVSGGPMEAGELEGRHLDLIDAMIESADTSVGDERIEQVERHACPGCGCCSGMFTANSMNCLNEAIGLALPGNGTIVATHVNRTQLFRDAAQLIVENAYRYYQEGDASVLPRSIATRQAFLNAMSLDIAMGGSTNTVLHLLAIAQEAEVDFTMDDIDRLSRKIPCLCKVAPNTHTYHVQDVNRAGGILSIMNELLQAGLVDGSVKRVRLHPRRGACLLQRWRTGGAEREHRAGRLRGQDGWCGRKHLEVRRACKGIRFARGGVRRDSGWQGRGWRRRGHHPRGTEGRSGYAGDALPYLLYQEPSLGQGVCPNHRRPFQRRDFRIVHRAHLSRSGGRRRNCAGQRWRHHRDRHSATYHQRAAERRGACRTPESGRGSRSQSFHTTSSAADGLQSVAGIRQDGLVGRQRGREGN